MNALSLSPDCPVTRFALAREYDADHGSGFCPALQIVAAGSDRMLVADDDEYHALQYKPGAGWAWILVDAMPNRGVGSDEWEREMERRAERVREN